MSRAQIILTSALTVTISAALTELAARDYQQQLKETQ